MYGDECCSMKLPRTLQALRHEFGLIKSLILSDCKTANSALHVRHRKHIDLYENVICSTVKAVPVIDIRFPEVLWISEILVWGVKPKGLLKNLN